MVGRGKKTNRKTLVKNPGFRREHDSSSESDQEAPLACGATDNIHRDEVLDLHDQLEQGKLLEDSDSDVPVRDANRNVVVGDRANEGLNKDLLDLVASLQAKQADMAARMQEMSGQLERDVPPYVWKKEGLRLQNDIAASAVSKLNNALATLDLNNSERARENVKSAADILNKRMKELRTAGWETVNAYKANPIAEDSDNDKRLQRAEKVAKERMAAKARKSKFNGRGRFYRRPYWNRFESEQQRDFPYRGKHLHEITGPAAEERLCSQP